MLKARFFFWVASLPLVTLAFVAGCGGASGAALCDAAKDCGLSEAQHAACVADFEGTEAVADQTKCDGELQAAIECAFDKGTCTNGTFSAQANCEGLYDTFKACVAKAGGEI